MIRAVVLTAAVLSLIGTTMFAQAGQCISTRVGNTTYTNCY